MRLWLDQTDWDGLVVEASRHAGAETGGVLMGWRSDVDVVVTHVIGPGPSARHEASSFCPDSEWQDAQIANLYEQSGRRLAYLGDWHTHPGGKAWPSRRDERTLRHIASTALARCPDPIMLILGHGARAEAASWQEGVFVLRDRPRLCWWTPRVAPGQVLLLPPRPSSVEWR